MEKNLEVKDVGRLYYEVAKQCGIGVALPRSQSGALFRQLAAMLNKNQNIEPVKYLQGQFFFKPGKHLSAAFVGTDDSMIAHHLYYRKVLREYNKRSILSKLRRDAAFIAAQKKALGISTIRDLLFYKKPNSSHRQPETLVWVLQGHISRAFLSVSRSYGDSYRIMGPYRTYLPKKQSLYMLRWIIMVTKELREYCESTFGEDCNF